MFSFPAMRDAPVTDDWRACLLFAFSSPLPRCAGRRLVGSCTDTIIDQGPQLSSRRVGNLHGRDLRPFGTCNVMKRLITSERCGVAAKWMDSERKRRQWRQRQIEVG